MWLVYSKTWVKTFLNITLSVKSQYLYRQQTYTSYQEKLFKICTKLKQQGLGYRKISYKLNELGFKSIRGKELKNNHVHSILKKGNIRKNRIKSLKSHNQFKKKILDMNLTFEEIDD